jgi:hypothetical protein
VNVLQLKKHCERLSTEAEDQDERNAYSEIVRHIQEHRPEKNGLILDLAYKARDYERRAGEVRQAQSLSMMADTLDTKARICKEMVTKLGGLHI